MPQRSCPTDLERRCVDIVASVEPRPATDSDTLAAQAVYSATAAVDLVHTACALNPFLEALLDGAAAHPITARLPRRAVALGHRGVLPTAGPTYMALIAPELLTLARFIQTPRAVAPWQLVIDMAEALGAGVPWRDGYRDPRVVAGPLRTQRLAGEDFPRPVRRTVTGWRSLQRNVPAQPCAVSHLR